MTSPRVISFLPSATEILHALGLGEQQVGRSHECDFPGRVANLAVCTLPTFDVDGSSADINRLVKEKVSSAISIYQIDQAVVKSLRPTHVLTQTLCDVCAVSLTDVQAAFRGENALAAKIVPLSAGSLEGVWADIRQIARSVDNVCAGEDLVSSLQTRIESLSRKARHAERHPRVAAIEWIEPLMAAGNWVPELIELAGGDNLFGKAGEHSPWMTFDELRSADPDIIVAMPCGFNLARTQTEMAVLAGTPLWNELRAVTRRQVYVCDGNQFMNRPGPRLVESLQIFCEIFHPATFQPRLQGIGWERL